MKGGRGGEGRCVGSFFQFAMSKSENEENLKESTTPFLRGIFF